jgi:hypothetical protein
MVFYNNVLNLICQLLTFRLVVERYSLQKKICDDYIAT